MKWNWQKPDWPNFTYDPRAIKAIEDKLLHQSGLLFGVYKHLKTEDKHFLKIELISTEALKTSEIEGEFLNRDSLQSSICKHFGFKTNISRIKPAEAGIADLMVDLYHNFASPLTHETLYRWHRMLMNGRSDIEAIGQYRNTAEPMRVVSGPWHDPIVHFEAPPSHQVQSEMNTFITWFNNTAPDGNNPLNILIRASIAHLYFESIHPFEDGNGRIGRALVEKALAQGFKQPTLFSISTTITQNKKAYYDALENANKDNEISKWLLYFASTILDALEYTKQYIEFLIQKGQLFDRLNGKLNSRQEKCLNRMFHEGPIGFKGGLSAENYISITKTTRPTATRDLADLVEKGALYKTGALRHTRYHLNLGQ